MFFLTQCLKQVGLQFEKVKNLFVTPWIPVSDLESKVRAIISRAGLNNFC